MELLLYLLRELLCRALSLRPSVDARLRGPYRRVDFRILFAYPPAFVFRERMAPMNQKDEKALFLGFWEKEAPATRKVISRIPQEKSDYRADPKARTAREIAWLLVQEEILLGAGLEKGVIEWQDAPTPATVAEILATYDKHHDDITKRLKALVPDKWARDVPFVFQGQEVMKETGYATAWSFFFDAIHHRGQLSTYLRPMGAKVPSIYGPSGDEQS
jgi:uncharacterized damage-inducible protein DinB